MAALLFSPRPRHAAGARPFFLPSAVRGTLVPAGAEGMDDMRQVNTFLRSASSRIGRRLKLIVAIAAASLPSAGA
jgi:hypothetical protein